MKIAICDDEIQYVQDILSHINVYENKIGKSFKIDCYDNPKMLLEGLKEMKYDLIYLDIQMDRENGITIAEEIRKIKSNCMVIFVTSYMRYFHDSFQVNAFQYLVKPIQTDLFEKELERAYRTFKSMNKSLLFPTTKGNIVLKSKEILYIETSYREYKVYCANEYYYGSVKSYQKMKEALTQYNFFKIQRSFLVNMEHIKQFQQGVIIMTNGDQLIVSRKQLKEFKRVFYNFMDS